MVAALCCFHCSLAATFMARWESTLSVKEYRGTIDGQPALIKYYPERKQTVIFWGGTDGRPDGLFHHHATINDKSPDEFQYLRVDGRLVVNLGYNRDDINQRRMVTGFQVAEILRDSLRRALRWWGMGS